jgi:hypothetical protein
MLGNWDGAEVAVLDFSPRTYNGGLLPDPVDARIANYDPATNRWLQPLESRPAPIARAGAVWDGKDYLVWSVDARFGATTATFDPHSANWTVLSHDPPPIDSWAYSIWTGTEMIVASAEGGRSGAFNPTTKLWRALPDTSVASPTSMTWTGTEVVLIDARNGQVARYQPSTEQWTAGAPAPFTFPDSGPMPIWTGSVLALLGGPRSGDGARVAVAGYDPVTDSWQPMADLPDAVMNRGLRLGNDLLVWGTTITGDKTAPRIQIRAALLAP